MAESVHEQIAAAIRTSLAAITGDSGTTYWYTPSEVYRVSFFEDRMLDSSKPVIYLLRAGDENLEEQGNQCVRGLAEFFLLLAVQYHPPTEIPEDVAAPTRATVINRAIRDVTKKLLADPQVGGLAENVFAEPLTIDRARLVEGWALAELRFATAYSFTRSTP